VDRAALDVVVLGSNRNSGCHCFAEGRLPCCPSCSRPQLIYGRLCLNSMRWTRLPVSGSHAFGVYVTERSFKGSLRRTSSPRLGSCCSSVNSSHSRTWHALWRVRQLILVHSTTKWVYIFLIFIFELGSLICGVAPTMEVLILGRAIAGVGGGGIFVSSTLLSVVFAAPVAHAPGPSPHHLGTNHPTRAGGHR
jgi:hypothetical protein